jgi:hypothetical protein
MMKLPESAEIIGMLVAGCIALVYFIFYLFIETAEIEPLLFR